MSTLSRPVCEGDGRTRGVRVGHLWVDRAARCTDPDNSFIYRLILMLRHILIPKQARWSKVALNLKSKVITVGSRHSHPL